MSEEGRIIFLWGLPGSGKSSLGAELAERMEYPFVDLDEEVRQREGLEPAALIRQHGEDAFRIAERDALKAVLQVVRCGVVATGGGTPCFHDNDELMKQTGVTVWLNVPLAELARRLSKDPEDRPLLHDPPPNGSSLSDRLQAQYHSREPTYRRAEHVLNGGNITARDILEELGPGLMPESARLSGKS